jgi:hypothetical protein
MDTTEAMAALLDQTSRAEARVGELDARQREAGAALAAAAEQLAEFERRGGGRQADRARLEQALAEARARVDEPWAARREGATRAVRDARAQEARFVRENLTELVAVLETDGRTAATRIDAAAAELVAAYAAREGVAGAIAALAARIGSPRPGDVSRTRCEALAGEAQRLIREGGEEPPTLLRDPRPHAPDTEVVELQPVPA